MSVLRLVSRAWYYFRLGYSTYLTFILGYLSTLVTVYYLAVKNIPQLLDIFPKFLPFAFLATVIGAPLSVAIGWVHLKRSALFTSEADIAVEANPYIYKLPESGIARDVQTPSELLRLRLLKKLAEVNGLLSDAEKAEIGAVEQKYQTLLEGKYVGVPRRH
ncbi:MAG: hypothetical protein ABSF82_07810 [Candidatus Bathyarchaeia archaeon]|jgi:hypothetical protein